jgi:hypothetical protein
VTTLRCASPRTAVALAVALALSAVGGCSSRSSNAPSNPAPSVKARTAAACLLVTKQDATGLFGRAASEVEVQNAAQAASVCGWKADSNPDPTAFGDITSSLLVYVYDDTGHYSERATPGAVRLAGVGDRAFASLAADLLTVEFVSRGQTVSLRYSITALAKHPSPRAAEPVLVGLARAAAARM